MTADTPTVARALVGLADTLASGYEVLDLLHRLVEECTHLLEVSAAGLLLAGPDGVLRVAAASSEQVRILKLIQLQVDRGPCLEAFSRGVPVVATGPEQLRSRWADFAGDLTHAGFHSVAAVPLRLRERVLGVLGTFSEAQDAPGPAGVQIAQSLADITTIALLQQEAVNDSRAVTAQLQDALDSRVLIEQAKGVVAAQSHVDVGDAFTLIRDHARGHELPLKQVAADLVEGRLTASELHPRSRRPST